uniref:Uncharacterized protein n=1 Tax=Romanomermis culicivorax TaxID=13658 RepID=A0A915J8J6_ROMCU
MPILADHMRSVTIILRAGSWYNQILRVQIKLWLGCHKSRKTSRALVLIVSLIVLIADLLDSWILTGGEAALDFIKSSIILFT